MIAPHTNVVIDPASGPQTGWRFALTSDDAGRSDPTAPRRHRPLQRARLT